MKLKIQILWWQTDQKHLKNDQFPLVKCTGRYAENELQIITVLA